MAMFNRDGTMYHPMTISDMMDDRFERNPFADVSDLLGSDWGCGLPVPRNAEDYQRQARDRATMIYGTF